MKSIYEDVREFHTAMRQPVGESPCLLADQNRADMRLALVEEECDELGDAQSQSDLPEVADALIDLIYVSVGYLVELGIDPAPLWDEVHATNMAKAGGPVRDDGKILKPPGWSPPRIAELLDRQANGFRAGDRVHHKPTGETWVLRADQCVGQVWPGGWPDSRGRASDCTLVALAKRKEPESC